MKTNNVPPLSIPWILLLILGIEPLNAQNPPATGPNESIKLSGSAIKAEDIVLSCDAVCVGEIEDMGLPTNSSTTGLVVYSGIEVKVLQILRGAVEHQIKFTLNTLKSPSIQEMPPNFGSSYIFFVNRNSPEADDPFTALKLLPATDDNIATIKKLIATAPASK